MNINDVYLYVQKMAKKDQRGLLTPAEFNIIAPVAQQKIVNRYLPLWPHDANVERVLNPLALSAVLTPVTTAGLATVTMPPDYMKSDTLTTTAGNKVSLVPNYKYVVMVKNKLKGPSVEYPLGSVYGNVIQLQPANVGSLTFRYLRKPKTPNWDYTIVNGQAVYNDTDIPGVTIKISQDFELPIEVMEEVAINILHDAGVVLEDALLIQYGLKMQEG